MPPQHPRNGSIRGEAGWEFGMWPTHPIQISNFEFRISNFRNLLGKRPAFIGGAWHPDSPRIGVPGILSR